MAGAFLTEISSIAVIPAKAGIQVSLVIDSARKLRSPPGAPLVVVGGDRRNFVVYSTWLIARPIALPET